MLDVRKHRWMFTFIIAVLLLQLTLPGADLAAGANNSGTATAAPYKKVTDPACANSGSLPLTVTGSLVYSSASTTNAVLPYVRVELWDGTTTTRLCVFHAAQDGTFSLSLSVQQAQQLFLAVHASDDYSVWVGRTQNNQGSTYGVSLASRNAQNGRIDFGQLSVGTSNAWHLYKLIADDAWSYLFREAGWGAATPDFSVIYPVSACPPSSPSPSCGTKMVLDRPASSLRITEADSAGADVLLHEYAHYVMWRIFDDYPKVCDPHPAWDATIDVGCAWAEGWADFLQAAIQSEANFTRGGTISLETPVPFKTGPRSEIAVMATLWDILDSTNEDPTWERMTARFRDIWDVFVNHEPRDINQFTCAWQKDNKPQRAELADLLAHYDLDNDCLAVDIVFIIDSSGSMSGNDSGGKRREATQAYLTKARDGDHVAIVDFDSTGRIVANASRLPDQKAALTSIIGAIDSSGDTNIREGVTRGCEALQQSPSGSDKKAAILLTDGQHNMGPYSQEDECFREQGWPVYTFGFGSADTAFLEGIATRTGGRHRSVQPATLVCEFQRVRSFIAGLTPDDCTTHNVNPGQTVQTSSAIIPGQSQATFANSWTGSDIVMSLTSPSGRVITRYTVASDVVHDKGVAFEVFTVRYPEPGQWQIALFGAIVPAGGEESVLSVSSIPAAGNVLVLLSNTGGSPQVQPGGQVYAAGTVVTLTASPGPDYLLAGWIVDGVLVGWRNSLTITMDTHHVVRSVFAKPTDFTDVPGGEPYSEAVGQLSARDLIRGYGADACAARGLAVPCYGPGDGISRAQMAALIARATRQSTDDPAHLLTPPACLVALSWDCENWGNPFVDRGGLDPNLWRNIGTLAHYEVAFGYGDGRFGPNDPVTHAQTISFITRAMKAKGYWVDQPDTPLPYSNVPAAHVNDVKTFYYYTQSLGGVPDDPTGWSSAQWNAQATRGWFARALWVAIDSYFGR